MDKSFKGLQPMVEMHTWTLKKKGRAIARLMIGQEPGGTFLVGTAQMLTNSRMISPEEACRRFISFPSLPLLALPVLELLEEEMLPVEVSGSDSEFDTISVHATEEEEVPETLEILEIAPYMMAPMRHETSQ